MFKTNRCIIFVYRRQWVYINVKTFLLFIFKAWVQSCDSGTGKGQDGTRKNKKKRKNPNLLGCLEWGEQCLFAHPYAIVLTEGQRCLEERPECSSDSGGGGSAAVTGCNTGSAKAAGSPPGAPPSVKTPRPAALTVLLLVPGRDKLLCLRSALLFRNLVHFVTDLYLKQTTYFKWLALITEE